MGTLEETSQEKTWSLFHNKDRICIAAAQVAKTELAIGIIPRAFGWLFQ